jgi:hypothetical protein
MTTVDLRAQKMAAIALANEVRSARSKRKQLWRAGPVEETAADFCDLLEAPPQWAMSWRLADALMALPKMGIRRVNDVLRALETTPTRTLGELSPRRREAVASYVRDLASPFSERRCFCGRKCYENDQCWHCRYAAGFTRMREPRP